MPHTHSDARHRNHSTAINNTHFKKMFVWGCDKINSNSLLQVHYSEVESRLNERGHDYDHDRVHEHAHEHKHEHKHEHTITAISADDLTARILCSIGFSEATCEPDTSSCPPAVRAGLIVKWCCGCVGCAVS